MQWLAARLLPLGLGSRLLGCRRLRRAGRRWASPAKQSQGVMSVEGEAPHGLFARGAEGDVHAPVVGQADGHQVFKKLLLLVGSQVRIVIEKLLNLRIGHVLLIAI